MERRLPTHDRRVQPFALVRRFAAKALLVELDLRIWRNALT
jgi:hypothetical protein